MNISVIGLGAMGYPMAKHLAKQHQVTVWNRTKSVAERHALENDTRLANDLRDCAESQVIVTILPKSHDVDEIVDRLLDQLRPGLLWIDVTSGDPLMSRKTADRLAANGIHFADAPVSGGPVGAEAAKLTVMVGSAADDFRRVEEVLKPCAAKIIHVGEVGFGHAIKALTNTMMAANVWIAAECALSMRRLGIEMKTAFEVINASSGRSNATENLLPLRLVEGQWPLLFKLSLHEKDIRIAEALVHDQKLSTPMLGLTSQLFTAALHELGPRADYIEVAKYVAKMSGQEW